MEAGPGSGPRRSSDANTPAQGHQRLTVKVWCWRCLVGQSVPRPHPRLAQAEQTPAPTRHARTVRFMTTNASAHGHARIRIPDLEERLLRFADLDEALSVLSKTQSPLTHLDVLPCEQHSGGSPERDGTEPAPGTHAATC